MTEATKRPWDLGVAEASDGIGMTYDNDPESPRSVEYDIGRTIGQLPEPWRTTVVKAVNSHDALVAALNDVLHIAHVSSDPDDLYHSINDWAHNVECDVLPALEQENQ